MLWSTDCTVKYNSAFFVLLETVSYVRAFACSYMTVTYKCEKFKKYVSYCLYKDLIMIAFWVLKIKR